MAAKLNIENPLHTHNKSLSLSSLSFCCSVSNVIKLCEVLHNPEVRLNEIGVEVFSHFKPQLADRLPINKISNIFKVMNLLTYQLVFIHNHLSGVKLCPIELNLKSFPSKIWRKKSFI